MIEQLQIEEDARLFGTRIEPHGGNSRTFRMGEASLIEDIREHERGSRFGERIKPGTHSTPPTNPRTSKQIPTNPEVPSDATNVPPEPPIYAWLAGTEPPENPDSVLEWRESQEIRRAKQRQQNAQDLEVFRNVEIAFPLKDDIPTCDNQDSTRLSRTRPVLDTTSCSDLLYRNIVDQYPNWWIYLHGASHI